MIHELTQEKQQLIINHNTELESVKRLADNLVRVEQNTTTSLSSRRQPLKALPENSKYTEMSLKSQLVT